MDEVKPSKRTMNIFLILLLVTVIVIVYFFVDTLFYVPKMLPQNSSISISDNTTLAFNQGILVSMIQLMKSTDDCKIASINYMNITRRLVDVDCVRALLQRQNITLKG